MKSAMRNNSLLLISNLSLALMMSFAALASGASATDTKSNSGVFAARDAGARGDGTNDDTVAIQAALDAAGQAGGVVSLAPGRYLVKASLRIPPGVTLQGVHDAPNWSAPLKGSVILATAGRDAEEGPALFEMGDSSQVRALTVYYPDQRPKDIRPYPWTFHLRGFDNTVEDVTLINSYNAIRIGPEPNVRHRIRNVYGCALRRGVLVDTCSDIGRIDNVHFHCHWWSVPEVGGEWAPVHEYMWKNCEAFIFGRTDWEYVNNTFVFPANIGYRFIHTAAGEANGHFSGIGADEAQICVKVESIQRMGLLISNGQFVAMRGEHPRQVVIDKSCSASVRLVNCAFWGPAEQNVVAHGGRFLSLSDCYFSSGYSAKTSGPPLVEADAGRLQVRGCSFDAAGPGIALRKGLRHAIISENNGLRGVEIVNEIGTNAIISLNEPAEPAPAPGR